MLGKRVIVRDDRGTTEGVEVIEGPAPRVSSDGRPAQSVYFRDPDGNLLELLAVT